MHPVGSPERALEVAFNDRLFVASNNMLAPVSGIEQFGSLSTGHFAAGCKAAMAGCTTTIPEIRDSNGKFNLSLLNSDSNMQQMLNLGWEFFVIPYWVEDAVPEFPAMAQAALNSHHSIQAAVTEVEVAASIADCLENMPLDFRNWDDAVAAVAATGPPCLPYIKSVGKYVKYYGGGPGAPLVQFLANFAKEYGESLKLGEDFVVALGELSFPDVLKRNLHVITAYVTTQLTSTKVRDGVAKLLTVGDIDWLKGKSNQPQVDEAEKLLAACWGKVSLMISSGELPELKAQGLFGRACLRIVLHLTKKQKWGADATEFDKMSDIMEASEKEKQKLLLPGVASSSSAASSSQKAGGGALATIAEMSDPMWVALQLKPLFIGNYYTHKDHGTTAFKLISCDAKHGAVFQAHVPLLGFASGKLISAYAPDLKNWRDCKRVLQQASPPNVSDFYFGNCKHVHEQLVMSHAFLSLASICKDNEVAEKDLIFTIIHQECVQAGLSKKASSNFCR